MILESGGVYMKTLIKMRKKAVFLSLVLVTFTYFSVGFLYGANPIELQMSLPAEMNYTDFSADYTITLNGNSYPTKGNPFFYHDSTYFPVRDLSDIYGFEIYYNEADRAVILTADEKTIVLIPKVNIYKTGVGSLIRTSSGVTTLDEMGWLGYLLNFRRRNL